MEIEQHALSRLSLVANNFGDGPLIPVILEDWFHFLGGRPRQVVMCDNGADQETQRTLMDLVCDGQIDKLVLVRPGHYDGGNHQVYIAEHAVPAMATRDYLLFFHVDTLPYRRGYDNWIEESLVQLERNDTFAIGGSFGAASKHHDAWPGWYFSHKCSLNFALMKRSSFIASVDQFMGEYVCSGYRTENPAGGVPGRDRFLLEWVFEEWIRSRSCYTLTRSESLNWSIFHTNVHGERLRTVRERYYRRVGIKSFLDLGNVDPKGQPYPPNRYYGKPSGHGFIKRVRIKFGASPIGPIYRAIFKKGATRRPLQSPVGPLPVERQRETIKASGPHQQLSLVLKVNGLCMPLRSSLETMLAELAERPRQVLLLLDPNDTTMRMEAWDAYQAGLVDKLIFLRGMDRGPLTPRFLVENGLLALAIEPYFMWVELGEVMPKPVSREWLEDATANLAAGQILAAHGIGQETDGPRHLDSGVASGTFLMRRVDLIRLLEGLWGSHIVSGLSGATPQADMSLAKVIRVNAFDIGEHAVKP